jgi:tRNA (guanine10-N2)-dimethyltransferase
VRLLLELSMECESLARAEALSAMRALGDLPEVIKESEGVLVVSSAVDPRALASRLALCHHVSEWLGSCDLPELRSFVGGVDVPGPIRVRATKVGERYVDLQDAARMVGGVVGESVGVDLHSPATDLRLVFSDVVHVGRLLASVDRASFERRKNRYMPFVYPASIHPKFARAAVNLTEVQAGQRLLDPFMGTGAILVEAAMVGCVAIGSDISERMMEGAARNLGHSQVKAELCRCDIGEVPAVIGEVDGIATDLPYGRSTSTGGEDLSDLYVRAFDAYDGVLRKGQRMVAVVPALDAVASEGRFEMVETHKLWVHRSLTRHFCVLRKR